MRKKIALIFGGRSLEREISIITAMQTLKNIDKSLYDVKPIYMFDGDFYVDGIDKISCFVNFNPIEHKKAVLVGGEFFTLKRDKLCKWFKPDIALLCCHGGEGENGTLQSLLEYNSIAYTSSSTLASACCMDKVVAKRIFESLLLNVLPYEVVLKKEIDKDECKVVERIESVLSYPIIVKPASQGSSIGIAVANNRDELSVALGVAKQFDEKILVETKLENFKEVNCACVMRGGECIVSETEQPCSQNDFLTFDDKYSSNGKMSGSVRIMPADIGSLELIVKANTERLYKEMGLFGVVRVDYLVDTDRNKVYVNEINTIPGSMAFYLFERIGISFAELIKIICEEALLRRTNASKFKTFSTNVLKNYTGGLKIRK